MASNNEDLKSFCARNSCSNKLSRTHRNEIIKILGRLNKTNAANKFIRQLNSAAALYIKRRFHQTKLTRVSVRRKEIDKWLLTLKQMKSFYFKGQRAFEPGEGIRRYEGGYLTGYPSSASIFFPEFKVPPSVDPNSTLQVLLGLVKILNFERKNLPGPGTQTDYVLVEFIQLVALACRRYIGEKESSHKNSVFCDVMYIMLQVTNPSLLEPRRKKSNEKSVPILELLKHHIPKAIPFIKVAMMGG